MHTLLLLLSVLLLVPGSLFALWLLRRLGGWTWHRHLHLLVLSVPLVGLGVNLFSVDHFVGQTCFTSAPRWDIVLSLLLVLSMGLVALAGIGLGIVRQFLLSLVVARNARPAGTELYATVTRLAQGLGIAPPRVQIDMRSGPLALTYGMRHPTVVLSPWMVDHLDRSELEAVLAHELAHIARRDALFGWLAQLLRDAFCYLPTSWVAYRHLQREKELASDDLALHLTHRPLGLASALAKVWQETVHVPSFSTGPALVGMESSFETRITRLLYPQEQVSVVFATHWQSLGSVVVALVGLFAVETIMMAVLLAPMGCGPLAPLGLL